MPPIHLTTEQIDRFYAKVSKTPTERGCLEWLGSRNCEGYGCFGADYLSHRVAWILANGQIPRGYIVCHRCDNPSCVNPAHLFLGTHADNTRDMNTKKRRRIPAKLTVDDVREMRSEKFAGWKKIEIARHFGISSSHVSNILSRKYRTHI